MLKINKHHSMSLPAPIGASSRLAMSPILSEDDELIEAIDRSREVRDDNWILDATPDTDELSNYWNAVERDIENDPEWIKFSDE